MTIFGSSPATALVKSSRVVTVVTGPTDPPVVLQLKKFSIKNKNITENL